MSIPELVVAFLVGTLAGDLLLIAWLLATWPRARRPVAVGQDGLAPEMSAWLEQRAALQAAEQMHRALLNSPEAMKLAPAVPDLPRAKDGEYQADD